LIDGGRSSGDGSRGGGGGGDGDDGGDGDWGVNGEESKWIVSSGGNHNFKAAAEVIRCRGNYLCSFSFFSRTWYGGIIL
jgi:hypothetical protein